MFIFDATMEDGKPKVQVGHTVNDNYHLVGKLDADEWKTLVEMVCEIDDTVFKRSKSWFFKTKAENPEPKVEQSQFIKTKPMMSRDASEIKKEDEQLILNKNIPQPIVHPALRKATNHKTFNKEVNLEV